MSKKETAMAPEELRDALKAAGFGQTEFGRLIGRGASAIRNYLHGVRPVSGETALLLRLLARHPELKEEAFELSMAGCRKVLNP
jgi:DNA-binding transcriptional regulator YiaG